jgi:SAM-dependent methyltransferase
MSIVRKFAADNDLLEGKVVVDVGSYNYNGTYRPIFEPKSKYIGADIYAGPNVDVIVGSPEWDVLKDVDAVVSGNTFEHVKDDALLLQQIHSILKPGGVICISTPSTGPVHDAPKWYRFYSPESISAAVTAAGFSVLSCEIDPHEEFLFINCVARKDQKAKSYHWKQPPVAKDDQVRIAVADGLSTKEKLGY